MKSDGQLHLVLDQGIPRDAAIVLRKHEWQCTHVGEVSMAKAADAEILKWAVQRGAVIVTLDADFHTMLTVSRARGPSVIRLRIEGLRATGRWENLSDASLRNLKANCNMGRW